MPLIRRILLILLLTTLPAHAEVTAKNIVAKFEAEWSGLKVGEMEIVVTEGGGHYEYQANINSAGMLRAFTNYRSDNTAKGSMENGKITPESYYTHWIRKKEIQQIDVVYANGKATESANPPEKRPKRPVVEHKDKDNTLDPVSAAFYAQGKIKELVEKSPSFPQKFSMPVFDARRVFTVELTINGYKKKRFNGKVQNLLEIVFYRTPVAGFNDKELMKLKQQDPHITFYLNDDYIPVMGTGSAPFGTANFYLTNLCTGGQC